MRSEPIQEDGWIRRALLAPNPRNPYDIGPEPARSAQNPPKFREHSPSQPVIPGEERAIEGQPVSKTLWVSGDRPVALVPSGWRFYSDAAVREATVQTGSAPNTYQAADTPPSRW